MGARTPLTVEQQRDALFNEALPLRDRILNEISRVRRIRPSLADLVRSRVSEAEQELEELSRGFLAYERRIGEFTHFLATASTVNQRPINLNTELRFAIFISELSTQRDTLRALLHQLNDLVTSRRTAIQASIGMVVNVLLLTIAIVSLLVAFSSWWEAQEASVRQQEHGARQLRTLDASRSALEATVGKTTQMQSLLDKSLQTSEAQLRIIREQQRLMLARPDVHLALVYPQKLSVVVLNRSAM